MPAFHLLRLRWVLLALFAGGLLVLLAVAAFIDTWKPREPGGEIRRRPALLMAWAEVPWSLRILFITFAAYGLLAILGRVLGGQGGGM